MNRIERLVHSRVANYPQLRIPLVAAYQRLFSLLPREDYVSDHPMQVRSGMFFGFHDKCPWSSDGQLLLAHRFDVDASWEQVEHTPITVGLLEHGTLAFHPLGTTQSWNWQQGAMLQWVGPSNHFIFNDVRRGQDVSRIMTAGGAVVAELPCHISIVSPDGRYAISYRFERMRYAAPEYAYRVGSDSTEHTPIPKSDGLRLVDLRTGQQRLLFSLEDIANIHATDSMSGAYHYFTHGLFCPSGQRLAFFHRWIGRDRVLHTRLFSCNRDGGDLCLFAVSQASHICWRTDEWILCTCKPPGRSFGYYLVRDRDDEISAVGPSVLDSDGHPQYSADGRFLLTDTYPDRSRMQSLLVYDMTRREKRILASLQIGFDYRYARRCDFHPRWSRDNSHICFDTAHSGTRSLGILEVPEYASNPRTVHTDCA